MSDGGIARREFLAGGAAGLMAFAAPAQVSARGRDPARPNVLWLISDDNDPFIGAYGDPVANTPNIDRLAAEGVRFEHFYSEAPVCAPSRFSLITGVYAESCGPAEHMRALGKIPSFLRVGWPALLRRVGYYCTNATELLGAPIAPKTDYNAPIDIVATWDDNSVGAHYRNRPAGAPFYAVQTLFTTHESQMFGYGPGPTRPEDVRVPAYLPDTPAQRADRAHYYDLMTRMDAEVGHYLQELQDLGVADDTIVFYFSDNGGVLPRSKRFATDEGLRTPLIVRFPPKWRHLAPGPPGSVVEHPASGVDLPPTVLSLAGLDAPDYMQGISLAGQRRQREFAYGQRSRMDEANDLQRAVHDGRYIYIRNYMPQVLYGQHITFMFNAAAYKDWQQHWFDGELTEVQSRFWRQKPREELYDLDKDPDQVDNLAREGYHEHALLRLRRALDAHMVATNDNGLIPEGSPLEGYGESRAPGAYPLRRIMRLAELASERDRDNLDTLIRGLDEDNYVLRYWAALGRAMLGEQAMPARSALERRLERDDSVHVQIAAALPAPTPGTIDYNEYIGGLARYLVKALTSTYVPGP
jgi:arylsulfatase A-like enzyme